MAVPKYYEMQKPILVCLADGGSHGLNELRAYVASYFRLSSDDIEQMLPSGKQNCLRNRVSWACAYLKKAGLIEPVSRASFVITDEGRKVVQDDPPVIDDKYLIRYEKFRKFKESGRQTAPDIAQIEAQECGESDITLDDSTPDDELESALDRINRTLIDDLLAEVMRLTPIAFERLVLDLMARMGYGTFENAATMTAATGDEGIDGIIMQDKLGFDLIYVQAKRWGPEHIVGRPEVQAFVGAIAGRSGKGLFVTTSRFTRQAEEYARARHVVLMDGERLARCMMEYNFGVVTRRTLEIKAIDATMFENYQDL